MRRNGNTLERNFINFPYRFIQINEPQRSQIIIPVVSSESRNYIPIDFLDKDTVVLNSANVIFDTDIYVFGIISSSIHNLWVKTVAGRLENRIRYTTGICFITSDLRSINENADCTAIPAYRDMIPCINQMRK